MKRLLCVIMALMIALCALPFNTFADNTYISETDSDVQDFNESFEYFDDTTGIQYSVSIVYNPISLYASANYVTLEDAAVAVREHMKNHDAKFTVYIKTTDEPAAVLNRLMEISSAHTGDPKEGDYIKWQYSGFKTQITRYKQGGYNYYTIPLEIPYFTTLDQEAELDAKINEVLDSLNLYEASDYEKVKGIYDYICKNVEYDYDNLNDTSYMLKHSAYAALINKKAVCQGYALLFYRLALELGIDARVIAGVSANVNHGWNIVKLDGKYYNLDTTWDHNFAVAEVDYEYFLRCNQNFNDHTRNDSYNTSEFNSQYPMAEQDHVNVMFKIEDGVLIAYRSKNISDIIIPKGVTDIAPDAFYGHIEIKSITIPESVETIGDSAFEGCSALENVYINSANTVIADSEETIPEGAVIYGYANSSAQIYAEKYSREFVCLNLGDVDGNYIVDNNDAIYLLYATIFGEEEYPLNQNCDFNNDRMLDNNDAIYLLYHTIFREEYPLS